MPDKENITPEEKLLHLIRNSGNSKSSKQSKPPAPTKNEEPKPSPKPSPKVGEPKLPKIKISFAGMGFVNFGLINKILFLIIFASLAIFCLDVFYNKKFQFKPYVISALEHHDEIVLEKTGPQPFSYYKQQISKRSLFKPQSPKSQVKRVVPAGPTFKELIKDFSLLGIVSGDNPQVIIEERKSKKTFFLNVGDFIGEVSIVEIHQDKVILEYKEERTALFL